MHRGPRGPARESVERQKSSGRNEGSLAPASPLVPTRRRAPGGGGGVRPLPPPGALLAQKIPWDQQRKLEAAVSTSPCYDRNPRWAPTSNSPPPRPSLCILHLFLIFIHFYHLHLFHHHLLCIPAPPFSLRKKYSNLSKFIDSLKTPNGPFPSLPPTAVIPNHPSPLPSSVPRSPPPAVRRIAPSSVTRTRSTPFRRISGDPQPGRSPYDRSPSPPAHSCCRGNRNSHFSVRKDFLPPPSTVTSDANIRSPAVIPAFIFGSNLWRLLLCPLSTNHTNIYVFKCKGFSALLFFGRIIISETPIT